MQILVVDDGTYIRYLASHLRHVGGSLCYSTTHDAMEDLADVDVDVVIVGVPYWPGSDKDEQDAKRHISLCRTIASSQWGHTHDLTVFTHMPRKEFLHRAKEAGVDLTRVHYYSKAAMEIPPILECIAEKIRGNPSSIGIPASRWLPERMTKEWLASWKYPYYPLLAEYACHRFLNVVGQNPNLMPVGLYWIWLIVVIESELQNGGLTQYFGNITAHDSDNQLKKTFAALRELRVHNVLALLEEAYAAWEEYVGKSDWSFETLDSLMAPFGARLYELLDADCYRVIDEYVQEHPEQFIDT